MRICDNKRHKLKNYMMCFIVALSALVLNPNNVLADSSVEIIPSTDICSIGDEIKVSVTVNDESEASVAPDVSIVYDPNRLTFIDCSSSYGGGGGGLITITDSSADITFSVLSGGACEISVSAVFDGDGANTALASTVINVDGEDTASGMGEEVISDTGVEESVVASADGSKFVSSVFADEFMPVGFYKTTTTYEEQMVEAAQFDMGNIVLLYVTDENGFNGNFDVYNAETGELSDFLQIMGIENRFIIVKKAPEDVQVPVNFTKASLQWNDQMLDAYTYTGPEVNGNVPVSDFFLLYAVSSTGNEGFYLYDQNEGTYQRYVEGFGGGSGSKGIEEASGGILSKITSKDKDVASDGNGSDKKSGFNLGIIIIIILAVLTVIFLVLFIITFIKLREYESYDYIDEDEFYEPEVSSQNRKQEKYEEINAKNQPGFVQSRATEDLPIVDEDEVEKAIRGAKYYKDEEESEPSEDVEISNVDDDGFIRRNSSNKVKASDLLERDMAGKDDSIDLYDGKLSREDKKRAKAEAKAQKKAEKKMKREYGEHGYVDWENIGESLKNNSSEMPAAKANPTYVLDSDDGVNSTETKKESVNVKPTETRKETINVKPVDARKDSTINIEPVIKEVQKLEKSGKINARSQEQEEKPKKDYYELREHDLNKENPAEMIRNIPANDNNRPVQPKPVQQFDFDDDFEFEFIKLDDED